MKRLSSKEANIICACFEAKDVMGNTTRALGCFQRDEFKMTVDSPTANMNSGSKEVLKKEQRLRLWFQVDYP